MRNLSLQLPACLLAGLSACAPGEGPEEPAAAVAAGSWFTDVTAEWGVDVEYGPAADMDFALPDIMAGGLAVFDADGDGRPDLFFPGCSGGRLLLGTSDGFRDASARSGLAQLGDGMGAAVGDVDADGDLDLYVTRKGPDRLFWNRGDGTFEDATERAGLAVAGWSTSAAFADLDDDGYLDLYVARYVDFDPDRVCNGWDGRRDWCGPKVFDPLADFLAYGNRDGTFRTAVPAALEAAPRPGLGVLCDDFDGDGRTDVYVANDARANQLWVRRRDGTFVDRAAELGCALGATGAPEAGMGLLAEDLDGDGAREILVTNLREETNTLYRARSGGYADAGEPSGLAAPSLAFTGFGVQALDVELDGDLDLAVANGHVNRGEPNPYSRLREPWNQLVEPNHLFLNDGRGVFSPAPDEGAAFCRTVRLSRALVAADLDRDGDLDLVVANLIEPARVLRNDAPRAGHWLAVRTRPEALGARLTVVAGGRRFKATVTRAASYLASVPAERHFGLGAATRYDRIEVRWPDGEEQVFSGGTADRRVVLERGRGR